MAKGCDAYALSWQQVVNMSREGEEALFSVSHLVWMKYSQSICCREAARSLCAHIFLGSFTLCNKLRTITRVKPWAYCAQMATLLAHSRMPIIKKPVAFPSEIGDCVLWSCRVVSQTESHLFFMHLHLEERDGGGVADRLTEYSRVYC